MPESVTVPGPGNVIETPVPPVTFPLTARDAPPATVQFWLAPRATSALIVFGPEPAATVMPLPSGLPFTAAALMVNVYGPPVGPDAMVVPAVLLVPVPVKFRLLMVKFASSVVLRCEAVVVVNVTFELRSG